jgi:hypothetical protein
MAGELDGWIGTSEGVRKLCTGEKEREREVTAQRDSKGEKPYSQRNGDIG